MSQIAPTCVRDTNHTLHYGFQLMNVLRIGMRWHSSNNRHVVEYIFPWIRMLNGINLGNAVK
jgi:hypothetical protein